LPIDQQVVYLPTQTYHTAGEFVLKFNKSGPHTNKDDNLVKAADVKWLTLCLALADPSHS